MTMKREDSMYIELQNYINGSFVNTADNQTMENINPATGNSISSIPLSKNEDVENAVLAAIDSQQSWSNFTIEERR